MRFNNRFTPFILKSLLAIVGVAISPLTAFAQAYPAKQIQLIVPYPAGGASDVIARQIGQRLAESFKQPVVVENKPGANGIIALQYVAKAPADGYTLLMTNIGPSAINPSIYNKLPYDAIKDFTPVTLTSLFPLVMVTNASSGINSVADLIARAKAAPDAISYAGSGIGTAGHLAMELFKTSAGVDIRMIGYKGDTPALQDLMGGHVSVMLATAVAAAPHINAGRLKALAVTTKQRLSSMPNVPTIAESGMPGFEAVSWGGIMVRSGTPKPIVDKLHSEVTAILKIPEVSAKLSTAGAEIVGNTPSEFQAYLVSETAKWAKVAKAANIKLE